MNKRPPAPRFSNGRVRRKWVKENILTEEPIWVVKRLDKWEDFQPNIYHPLLGGVKGPQGSIGFLVVFARYEDALEFAGGDVARVQSATRRTLEDGGGEPTDDN